ncbi:MAG: class I SAM-dependent methyltransferase [Ignavibacterium sp.]|uniref:class I SAM-dependent methyltransferase n=1 Tax=Ignavibacterium sp. TaxID=2651167 RepID=UPI00404A2889
MSKQYWNERFSSEDYIYGTEPNTFLKEQLENLKPGKALFLGEGEGRNAVYAATLGWQVDAVDFSSSARVKALKLAEEKKVNINYEVCDLNEYLFKENYYDLVVMIFLHLPVGLREKVFYNSIRSLKENGRIIIEAFSKQQIKNTSGGPRSIDLLYSEQDILDLVKGLNTELIETKIINLEEGQHHKGKADVVRYVGVKVNK